MKCYARWNEDINNEICFRDQTILQFGDSWQLLASFVLLNPGSAKPINSEPHDEFLIFKKLPYFINRIGCSYYEFSVDRLMNDLAKLYQQQYPNGGVLKLYNLFNLKNQDSRNAIEQFKDNRQHPDMFTSKDEILFCDAPVVIASGDNAFVDEDLTRELKKYIALAKTSQLYSVSKKDGNKFEIVKTLPRENGTIKSYHPSYTFKYGNSTILSQKSA